MTRTPVVLIVALLALVAPIGGVVAAGSAAPAPHQPSSTTTASAVPDPGTNGSTDPGANVSPGTVQTADRDPGSDPTPKVQSGLLDDPGSGPASGSDRVTVVVEAAPGRSDRVADVAARYGRVELHAADLVRVRLPRRAIATLAAHPSVGYVRAPIPVEPVDPAPVTPGRSASVAGSGGGSPALAGPVETGGSPVGRAFATSGSAVSTGSTAAGYGAVTSEGVEAIDADAAQAAGYDGEGVTVAVIDAGFDVDHPEIAGRVARTKDFSGSGFDEGPHGTGVAEVVTDVAPGVNLVLVKATTYLEILAATNWIDAETDADVVSMSLGLTGGVPLDGSARLDREIDESVGNGTTWTVSAGNYADEHWNGTWRDGDGDGWYNFTASDETMAVEGPVSVQLQWRDWPGSDQDYDLYLIDENRDVVASSTDDQTGRQAPTERLECSCVGTHYLVIKRVDADGTADFDMFVSSNGDQEYVSATRSLSVPATGERTIAVGAVNVQSRSLEPFSSQGPTTDGRIKPEVVAPDGVSTSAHGHEEFYGTSAAAPHVAGAAALLLDADGSLSPGTIARRLQQDATPVTLGEPNTRSGWGMIDVDGSIRPRGPSTTRIATEEIGRADQDSVPVDVQFARPPDGGEVVVRLVGSNGSVAVDRAPVDQRTATTRVRVDATSLSDGTVQASARIVDELGGTNPGGFTATSAVVEKDTLAPSVSGFDASAPANGTVRVTFDASEPLSTVRVVLSDDDGTAVATLQESDFSVENGTYAANASVGLGGNYTVRLRTATDAAGNDGSGGATDTVEVNGSVTGGIDPDGDGRPSTSADADARHEDVDGDGEVTILDVQVLYRAVVDGDASVVDNTELFDYNGDGGVDIVDVQRLFATWIR